MAFISNPMLAAFIWSWRWGKSNFDGERRNKKLGYIITAIFLCQILVGLNKKCLFALLRKSMWFTSGGSKPSLLRQGQTLIDMPALEILITGGFLKTTKPGAAHCNSEVPKLCGNNSSSQVLKVMEDPLMAWKIKATWWSPNNGSFLINFLSLNISQ